MPAHIPLWKSCTQRARVETASAAAPSYFTGIQRAPRTVPFGPSGLLCAVLLGSLLTIGLATPVFAGILSPRDLSDVNDASAGDAPLTTVRPLPDGPVVGSWTRLSHPSSIDRPTLSALGPVGSLLGANQCAGFDGDFLGNSRAASNGNPSTVGNATPFGFNLAASGPFESHGGGRLDGLKSDTSPAGVVPTFSDAVELSSGGHDRRGSLDPTAQAFGGKRSLLRLSGAVVLSPRLGTTDASSSDFSRFGRTDDLPFIAAAVPKNAQPPVTPNPAGAAAWQALAPKISPGDPTVIATLVGNTAVEVISDR